MCMSVLPECMYVHHMPGANGGQKKAWDSLELEL